MIFLVAKLLAGFLLCFTAGIYAESMESKPCIEFYPTEKQHCRVSVRHIERGGIGYDHGYTTLEGFFAPHPDRLPIMPFLDVRGHVFDNGKLAANAGLGVRAMYGCRANGLNVYYDYRNACRMHYNQVGLGVETLGERWDFRLNGYIPVGRTSTCPFQTGFVRFSGHNMIVSQKYQFAMPGFNAELGFPLGYAKYCNFFGAFGPYYFTDKCGLHIWGGKGRLTCRVKDYLTLEVSNSYDKMFRNRFQFQITLTLPFGRETEVECSDDCKPSNALISRMVQPVERQEIIVEGCKKQCTTALNPATGLPFYFVFVDNTSHSQGTYESPYPTLALAQNNSGIGDIIYVLPGNGTTKGMDEGITLQRNQKFWGSGVNHALQTMQGSIVIPAQSTSSPRITNILGDVITVSTINEISGFTITDAAGSGIMGSRAENIDVSKCTIDNSQSDQIHLNYIDDAGVTTLSNLTLTNGQIDAIVVDSSASSNVCTVSNCSIQGNAVNSFNALFVNQATVSLTNNTIERNGTTSTITLQGPSTLLVSGNTFDNNTSISSAPLIITAATNPLAATITDNIIRDNVCGGIHFVLNNTSSAQLSVSNNTITNNGSGSIGPFGAPFFIDPTGSSSGNCSLQFIGNRLSGNNGNGALYCANGSFNSFQVNATQNALTNNQSAGFVFANNCSAFTLAAINNTISNGTDHGITTQGAITTATIAITKNQITGNTNLANAIALSHGGTDLNLTVINNNLSNNETSGIIMFPSFGALENVVVDIENNTINNNQNLGSNATGGVDLEQFTNLTGKFMNNILFNNVGAGLFVGSGEASPSVCLTMSGNNSTTGYTLSSGTGTFNLAPCNAAAVNTGTITTIGTITPVQSCPGAGACPS